MSAPSSADSTADVAGVVSALMPELLEQLDALVRIRSISGDGVPAEPLQEAHDFVARLFREAGVPSVDTLHLPDTLALCVVNAEQFVAPISGHVANLGIPQCDGELVQRNGDIASNLPG